MPSDGNKPMLALVKHRLPPVWDGNPVKWDPFKDEQVTICGRGSTRLLKVARCDCGSTRSPLVAAGWRQPLPGETRESTHPKTGRFGRTVHVPTTVPAIPVRDLTAQRCPDCGLDTVWDMRTDEWWELGPEDYGPEGSTRPVEREWEGGLFDLLPGEPDDG